MNMPPKYAPIIMQAAISRPYQTIPNGRQQKPNSCRWVQSTMQRTNRPMPNPSS